MSYRLGDLTVKKWNSWDRVPRDPVTVGTAIVTSLGGSAALAATTIAFGVTVAGFVGYLAITAVTSWAISALSPKPDFSSFGSQGTLVNARDATAPVDFVYGQVRKGGTVSYYESTGEKNKFLHQIIVLAGHEVEQIGDIYVNDEIVTLDGDGFVTGDTWNSKIRIQKFDGSQTSAPADLLAESELTGSDALTSNFVGNDIAYLYVRYEYDGEVFASGVPLITAVVQGKKVYDPRTSTTAYSNNAALCIRDFITSTYGLSDSAIDDVSFSSAANESDENVILSGVGTEKRYTINGIVKASSPTGKVLGDMSTACAGTLFWGSGYWKLKVGAYTAPVKTLTLDDLRGPINLQTRSSTRDSFNGVGGTFNNADGDFITSDYPPIKSSVFQAEDGGDEMLLDLPLPFTTSASTAQRIAKMTLYRGREQMTISADFGLEAFNIEVGDIIAFDNDRYGFDGKEFEVIGWKFASNQEAGDLRVTLTLQETSEAAFDWNAEESDIINNNTNLPDFTAGLQISNLSVSQVTEITSDGTHTVFGRLSWDVAFSAFTSYYEVQWRKTTDADYQSTTTPNASLDTGLLIDGTGYTARVRAVAQNGYKGSFASIAFTAQADTTAPGVPTSLSVNPAYRSNVLQWTNPTDSDFKEVEIYVNTSNNSGTASLLGSSAGTNFTHGGLAESVTRYYWAKSKDFTGNLSGFSSVASGTTLADPQDGTDGTDGTNGATGDTVVTGKVFYQTLQASAPSTPSASIYNVSTASFSGLTSDWSLQQPSIDITDTSIKEWSSNFTVTINGTTSAQTIAFTSPSGAIQVTDDLESDNYISGLSGWRIQRNTGNAEFGAASIRGTLSASQIQIDNVTLDSDGSGNLIIKSGGVDTQQVAVGAISGVDSSYTSSGNVSYATGAGSTIASVSTFANSGDKFLGIITVSWYSNSTPSVVAINQNAYLNNAGMSLLFHANKPTATFHGGSALSGIFTATSSGTVSLTFQPSQNYDSGATVVANQIRMSLIRLKR